MNREANSKVLLFLRIIFSGLRWTPCRSDIAVHARNGPVLQIWNCICRTERLLCFVRWNVLCRGSENILGQTRVITASTKWNSSYNLTSCPRGNGSRYLRLCIYRQHRYYLYIFPKNPFLLCTQMEYTYKIVKGRRKTVSKGVSPHSTADTNLPKEWNE